MNGISFAFAGDIASLIQAKCGASECKNELYACDIDMHPY